MPLNPKYREKVHRLPIKLLHIQYQCETSLSIDIIQFFPGIPHDPHKDKADDQGHRQDHPPLREEKMGARHKPATQPTEEQEEMFYS